MDQSGPEREPGMQPFLVTASEALLLGRCLELYLQRRVAFGELRAPWSEEVIKELEALVPRPPTHGVRTQLQRGLMAMQEDRQYWQAWDEARQDVLFLGFLGSEFGRFFPQLADKTIKRPAEPPSDTEWVATKQGLRLGYSAQTPGSLYHEVEGKLLRVDRRRLERTTDVLIAEWLDRVVAKSLFGDIRYALPEDWARMQFEAVRVAQGNVVLEGRLGNDDPQQIIQRLEQLVASSPNNELPLFESGRLFGRLEGFCNSYQNLVLWRLQELYARISDAQNLELVKTSGHDAKDMWGYLRMPLSYNYDPELEYFDETWSSWKSQMVSGLRGLISCPALPQGGLGGLVLQRQVQRIESDSRIFDLDEDGLVNRDGDVTGVAEIFEIESIRSSLMFALGELTGRHWDHDATRTAQDALSHDPRFTRLSPTANVDRVRGQMELVDSWFRQGYTGHVTAVNIVEALENAIEALTLRCWPADFNTRERLSKSRPLYNVLSRHLHCGSDDEQQFASEALPLYRYFRNASQHDLDTAAISMTGALYFLHGIRHLLELSDAIKSHRNQ